MKHFHWYFYVGLGLFQSPPCRYLQRTLLFLCPMQLLGFDDNCFHWTQIRFLSLRIRPSILWVGPGYNYTESSSSHQCVCIISCHLICSNCFYLQQIFFLFAVIIFYLQQLLFICNNCILFCSNFSICSMSPSLWATVLNRGKRKSFCGKLHLWSNPVRKHVQKHKP